MADVKGQVNWGRLNAEIAWQGEEKLRERFEPLVKAAEWAMVKVANPLMTYYDIESPKGSYYGCRYCRAKPVLEAVSVVHDADCPYENARAALDDLPKVGG